MKLKPRQVIGLAAIVVFGGMMIFRMTQPSEREIMEQRLASLPRITAADTPMPAFEFTPPAPVAPLDLDNLPAGGGSSGPLYEYEGAPDYFNLGSQAAKDDLYCGGVLGAEFDAIKADAHPDAMSLLLRDSQALDDAGISKLKAEGHANDSNYAGFTLAYADKAGKDHAAKTLRIPVAECTRRAAALASVQEAGK